MPRIFVTQFLPKKYLKLYEVSQAGYNFNRRIISFGLFDKVYSFPPINIPTIISEGEFEGDFTQIRMFPHKVFFRFFNMLIENLIIFRKVLSNSRSTTVWFYNLTVSNIILFLLLKITLRKVFIVLADFEPNGQRLSKFVLIKKCLMMSNGIISLSDEYKNIDNRNTSIMHGIIDSDNYPSIDLSIGKNEPKSFLFSGAIESFNGIELALKTFAKLPNTILYITGRGAYSGDIIKYSEQYSNIKYLGFLDYDEYVKIYGSVVFCLSLRNPAIPFNKYNFPSKIIEYIQNGKLVISTMKYRSFPKDTLIDTEYSVESLLSAIKYCVNLDVDSINQKILPNRIEIIENYGKKSWKNIIKKVEGKALSL